MLAYLSGLDNIVDNKTGSLIILSDIFIRDIKPNTIDGTYDVILTNSNDSDIIVKTRNLRFYDEDTGIEEELERLYHNGKHIEFFNDIIYKTYSRGEYCEDCEEPLEDCFCKQVIKKQQNIDEKILELEGRLNEVEQWVESDKEGKQAIYGNTEEEEEITKHICSTIKEEEGDIEIINEEEPVGWVFKKENKFITCIKNCPFCGDELT